MCISTIYLLPASWRFIWDCEDAQTLFVDTCIYARECQEQRKICQQRISELVSTWAFWYLKCLFHVQHGQLQWRLKLDIIPPFKCLFVLPGSLFGDRCLWSAQRVRFMNCLKSERNVLICVIPYETYSVISYVCRESQFALVLVPWNPMWWKVFLIAMVTSAKSNGRAYWWSDRSVLLMCSFKGVMNRTGS